MLIKFKNWFLKASLIKKTVVILAIIFLGWLSWAKLLPHKATIRYQTTQVERGSVISTVSESGNISAISQTNITSPTNGIIQEIYVKNGDLVVTGQSLFKVKSTATNQEKASAYAAYLSTVNSAQSAQQNKQSLQAALEAARQDVLNAQDAVDTMNYNRNNSLNNPSTKQPYTQNEIDSLQSALTNAKENFTAAETKYNQAGTSISAASASQNSAWLAYQATQDSVVTAPIDGTVANMSATIGSNVGSSSGSSTSSSNSSSASSSSSTTSNSTVLVIGDFSSLNIKAQVNEVDIPKIHAGQKATITLDAFPDKTFVGEVSSVDLIGTSNSGVVTYNVYVGFVSPPPDIQPGMSASLVIQIDRKDNTLFVPTTAIQTTNGDTYARVMKNGKVTQIPVETGIASDSDTEILSGLSEGDTVVTSVVTQNRTGTQTGTSPFSGLGGRGGFGGGGFGGAAIRRGQ